MRIAPAAMSKPILAPTRLAPSTLRLIWANRSARIGLLMVLLMTVVAIGGPLIASDKPIVCRHDGRLMFPAVTEALHNLPLLGRLVSVPAPFGRPGSDADELVDSNSLVIWPPIRSGPLDMSDATFCGPSREHLLGTDDQGRDVAARLIHGAAVSLQVGLGGMLLAACVGVAIGSIAGFGGLWTDRGLSRVIEITMCFPVAFLALAAVAWIQPRLWHLIVIIGLTRWTTVARLVRAEVLRYRRADFVLAAVANGSPRWWVITRHVLPAAMAPVWAVLAFGVADAILIEAALSWLGFGVAAPNPSWGQMLRDAFDQLRAAPYLVYPPCAALIFSVMGCHLLGDGLRRVCQPHAFTGRGLPAELAYAA